MSEATIAAIASGTTAAGIGVIRVSGELSLKIAQAISQKPFFAPRVATFSKFYDENGSLLDEGLILYFKAPNSFTGEDCIEFQGHGGHIVLSRLLKRIYALGAEPARAGEFTERAFLNGKLDLIQAEAIHDLIMSQSDSQAKAALNSLTGQFSEHVNQITDQLINLRVYVEASIDFSEEDIDFISDGHVGEKLNTLHNEVSTLLSKATQGKVLTNGITVVLAGEPNAGKSSLLNALSGEESAIVTEIAGTTRDTLKETILIQGIPLHIVDTAGLRDTDDLIEKEGIKRSHSAIEKADLVLWIHDSQKPFNTDIKPLPYLNTPVIHILNKIDLSHFKEGEHPGYIAISAKNGIGMDSLKSKILEAVHYLPFEGAFSARERHILSLEEALQHLKQAKQLLENAHSIEIVAEEIRLSLNALGSIVGKFTTEDLLGAVFSSFCVGK